MSERKLWCRSLPGENREFLGYTWPWQRPRLRHAGHDEGALALALSYTTERLHQRGNEPHTEPQGCAVQLVVAPDR